MVADCRTVEMTSKPRGNLWNLLEMNVEYAISDQRGTTYISVIPSKSSQLHSLILSLSHQL